MIDTHTHTISSLHAYSTLEENVRAAAAKGLHGIGVTDHYSPMIGHGPGYDKRDYQFLINLSIIPREWHGIKVYRGAEVDIVNLDGELYGFDEVLNDGSPVNSYMLDSTDYHIVSVHRVSSEMRAAGRDEIADMYIRAIRQEKSAIIGHINRAGLKFNEDAVLDEVKRLNKAIEINESTLNQSGEDTVSACRRIARMCAEKGVYVTVASDSHISATIGEVSSAMKLVKEAGIPEELIVNRDVKSFEEFLKAAVNAG